MKLDKKLNKAKARLVELQQKPSYTRKEYFEESRLMRRIEKLQRQREEGEKGNDTHP